MSLTRTDRLSIFGKAVRLFRLSGGERSLRHAQIVNRDRDAVVVGLACRLTRMRQPIYPSRYCFKVVRVPNFRRFVSADENAAKYTSLSATSPKISRISSH